MAMVSRRMSRMLGFTAVAVGLAVFASPATAQPGGRKGGGPGAGRGDEVKDLEADLAKLKARTTEIEAKLKKAKGDDKGSGRPANPWGFGGPEGRRGPGGFTPPAKKGPEGNRSAARPEGPPRGFTPPRPPQAPAPRAAESRSASRPGDFGRGPGGFGRGPGDFGRGPGSFDRSRTDRGWSERSRSDRGGFDRNRDGRSRGGRGSFGPPSRPSSAGPNADLSRRLDHLIREIEELKRSLNRR